MSVFSFLPTDFHRVKLRRNFKIRILSVSFQSCAKEQEVVFRGEDHVWLKTSAHATRTAFIPTFKWCCPCVDEVYDIGGEACPSRFIGKVSDLLGWERSSAFSEVTRCRGSFAIRCCSRPTELTCLRRFPCGASYSGLKVQDSNLGVLSEHRDRYFMFQF